MTETAILMAAGMGTRMRPLTEHTPKPLIEVNGTPMIETVISGLHQRGIRDIYIVTGYLGEQFEEVRSRHPGITLISNPDYEIKNNISSVYAAREVLGYGDTFICEADLYISDPDIFSADLKSSCYYGRMVEGHSDDWVFDLADDGYITRVGKQGDDRYNMVGISFFRQSDALILKDAITAAYDIPGNEQLFWDDVVNDNLDRLKLTIHPVDSSQIVEIDTCEELASVEARLFVASNSSSVDKD